MGEDPDRIREQIAQTRAEMGGTVDALSYKADVKSRAKESIQDKRDSAKESVVGASRTVKEKLVGAKDSVADTAGDATDWVGDATPDSEQIRHQARQAKGLAQENPLGLAIGSIAVGYLVGLLLPATRVEDEKLGEVSDQVLDRVKETGQDAFERGKQVAGEAVDSARETAEESGREQGKEVAASVKETARELAPTGGNPDST